MKKKILLLMGVLAIGSVFAQNEVRAMPTDVALESTDNETVQEISLDKDLAEEIEIVASDDEEAGEEPGMEDPSDTENSEKTDLSLCDIQVPQSIEYTGEALTPEIVVKNGEELLLQGQDYTLEYADNLNFGTATVTITGIGKYEGTVKKEFQIILAQPKVKSVVSKSYNSLKITWSKVPGATGYCIYRKSGDAWKKIGTTSGTSFVSGTSKYPVKTGVTYEYTVGAYCKMVDSTMYGGYNEIGIKGKAVPNKPTLVSAKSIAENKISLSWKKAAGATNYLIYRRDAKGKWQLLKNVKDAGTTSYTHVSSKKFPIVKGKNYTYTVRSYTTVENTKGLYDSKGLKVKALSSVEITNEEALDNARKVIAKVTNSHMTKAQKLQACFNWVISKPYVTRRRFSNFPGWPAVFANDHFVLGGGNCHSDAGAFAYLAKALGYKNVYVCTDAEGRHGEGHSWTEINGLVYDPLFSEAKNYSKYYGATYRTYILRPILHIAI